MIPADRKQFATALAQTYGVYNQQVTDLMLDAWWMVFEPYKLQVVIAALTHHMQDYEGYGYRAPMPADIKKLLEVTLPEIARRHFGAIIADALQRQAPHREKIARAQADERLGLLTALQRGEVHGAALRAICAIEAEPQVIEARIGVNFREEQPTRARLPSIVQRALTFIGRRGTRA